MRKLLFYLTVFLILGSAAGVAFGDQTTGTAPPPPAFFHKMGFSGICADQQYLYVMAGGKILEYEISEMTLLGSVDLPEIPPPQGVPPKVPEPGKGPPPMGGPPHGLWASNGVLYVLAGPMIHRYSIPDLTFQSTVELPKPALPQADK